ncbi:hypothetical protein L2E82_01588 [Cichorium intybus]|uniref:Uncharacterized protein n=1 Tax=Cichorium intybus TaxID=13427 RepID=A0ACB9H0V4_CICIN|nr:hypothetical protein L2E82_01588 [Cichorium intybus]
MITGDRYGRCTFMGPTVLLSTYEHITLFSTSNGVQPISSILLQCAVSREYLRQIRDAAYHCQVEFSGFMFSLSKNDLMIVPPPYESNHR